MSHTPLISILVPTYNRTKFLEECLDSIVVQKGFQKNEVEIIVSDNSDNDETKLFMKGYEQQNDHFVIRYNKNKENLGMVGNWNKLLDMCRGKYFVFLSDDDMFYDKDSLSHLYEAVKTGKIDCVTGRKQYINEYGKKIDYKDNNEFYLKGGKKQHTLTLFDQLFWGNSMGFGGILFKNKGYRFGQQFKEFADYEFNLKYITNPVILINTYVFKYRYHSSQLITQVKIIKSIKLYSQVLQQVKVSIRYKILFFLKYSFGLIVLGITGKLGGKVIHFLKSFFITK